MLPKFIEGDEVLIGGDKFIVSEKLNSDRYGVFPKDEYDNKLVVPEEAMEE